MFYKKKTCSQKKPQEKCIWQLKTYIMNVFHLSSEALICRNEL